MSIISASTTTTTALQYTADTTGTLVFKTGATPTTALTLNADQSATFAGTVNFATAGFTNLSYTGTFTGGTGVIAIGTGQIYKDASGNVGIGTTTPSVSGKFAVFSAVAQDAASFSDGTNYTLKITSGGSGVAAVTGSSGSALSLGANASEAMRIGTNGNVSIGTATTAYKFFVFNSAATSTTVGANTIARLSSNASGADAHIQFSDNVANAAKIGMVGSALYFSPIDTEAMRITVAGNVGIGTTAPNIASSNKALTINASAAANTAILELASGGVLNCFLQANNAGTYFGNGSAIPIQFYTSSTERMRITSSGNVCIGATSNALGSKFGIVVSGTGAWATTYTLGNDSYGEAYTNTSGTANYIALGFYNNGQSYSSCGAITVAGSSTTYVTSSDYRLKENIAPMTGALDKVVKLKPVTYTWKQDGSNGQGFIAHELQEIVPECVVGEKDAVDEDGSIKPQGVDTSFLVATLTAAIQELKAEFDEYKATHP